MKRDLQNSLEMWAKSKFRTPLILKGARQVGKSWLIDNFGKITPPIYCLFFVLSGAHLDLHIFAAAGTLLITWGGIFVVSRIVGKVSGAYLGGVVSKVAEPIRKYLGWTLIPQAGVAVGLPLMITATSSYYGFKSTIINITLLAVAFNVIVGPLCTKYALFKANEATKED